MFSGFLKGASVGVYSDWAERYFESGLYTVPCGVLKDKAPPMLNWTDFCDVAPSEKQVHDWAIKYKDANQIGLLLGKSTGKSAFDFDYAYDPRKCKITEEEFKKDRQRIEKEIMELIPESFIGKIGAKGWTRFYQWDETLLNKNCNRNGVRLFDFLSSGRQTIIPPSIHSTKTDGNKIIYKWIDETLEEAKELPKITMDIIDTIISLYTDKPLGVRPELKDLSRHERVMYFIIDVLRVDDDLKRIALSAIEYDKKVNKDNPYLSDKKHQKTSDALVNAEAFVNKLNKWMIKKNLLSDKDERKENRKVTTTGWDHFLSISFGQCRKDVFSEETYVRKTDSDIWTPIKNYEDILKSYARKAELPKTHVPEELARWTYENSETKFLCDIPKWDGIDRISKIAGSIKSPKFTQDQIIEIFKHWGVNIFMRLKDPAHQNRCIILKGDQGKGKDNLVKALLKDFKPYYSSTNLAGTIKDVLEIVSRLLVVHIEEFDQTKHLPDSFIKSLITQPSSFFRESYGRQPNSKPMRASYITTANIDDILRDPTGNRRFVLIPVEDISWDYPQNESPQVIAQWITLFEQGEYHNCSKSTEDAIKSVINEYTPAKPEESIIDSYRIKISMVTDTIAGHREFRGRNCFSSGEIIELLSKLSKDHNCSLRRVQSALKNAGYSVHTKSGARYFKHPSQSLEYKEGDYEFDVMRYKNDITVMDNKDTSVTKKLNNRKDLDQ